MSGAGAEGVSKVKVKKEIKTIVENLETILGDLKDVAKELKEVVHEIDTLTCDLQLEEDGMTDSSKTDTLNSSSSSTTTTTTASSLEKMKLFHEDSIFKLPAPVIPAVLTVLKKSHPPLPPPRLTPLRAEDHNVKNLPQPTLVLSGHLSKSNGSIIRNGGIFPLKTKNRELFSSSPCFITSDSGMSESGLVPTLPRPMPLLRHEKNKCPKAPGREPRERVRFSETVQYHGYCPDCDLQYDVDNTELHLQTELNDFRLSPVHCCSSSPSPPPPHAVPHQLMLENGGLSVSHSFPPMTHILPPCTPPQQPSSLKPHKTILRKSTTTTV
ncbi:protein Largen [Genypterus blacodes]|uniref:protein Largen n=1 Tax=Genypterus blacodes TaxID=154954 RepID=UPI003F77822E